MLGLSMIKNDKKTDNSKPIITIEPTTKSSYRFQNNEISLHNINKSSLKKEIYSSFIYAKDVISGIVEINRRVEEDDLQETIELEAYDALSLDVATEYKIINIEADNQGANRLFNVFAFDTALIAQTFKEVKAKTKFIDYITATPFLIDALYKKNILDINSTECFIYFQKEDAFLAIYRKGQYLYSKSLNYSITQIHEKFCELMGERVDENDFINFLIKDGLNTENQSYQQHLIQLFGEMFVYINDVIVFFQRSYEEENIDRVYIGSEFGVIQGVEEYSKSYLGFETLEFNFNFAKNRKEWPIDQMHVLLALNAQLHAQEQDDPLNLTIFKRPPSFGKRTSGRLTYGILLGLLVALAYPAYNYGYGYYLNMETQKKQQEYVKVHAKAQALRDAIAQLTAKKKAITDKLTKENERLSFRKKLLDEIHTKKVKYPMKAVMFQDLSQMINEKNIKISKIVTDNKEVVASLVSQSDKQLTELLKEISETEKYHVSTKKIIKKDKKTYYTSDVRTEVR